MLKKMLVLMMVVMLGISFATLSWAGSGTVANLSVGEQSAHETASLSSNAPIEEGYLIGPGDVLDIAVWKDEALTRSCVVRPDGFISFPLAGDVRAAGRTASQLKTEIEGRLISFVPGITLSLEIKQVNSMIIYVIGRVNVPGRQLLNVDVNVLQALASAGGLNPFAKKNSIKVLRHGANETTIFPFQYDEVIEGNHLEQNIYLKRGDVVVVP